METLPPAPDPSLTSHQTEQLDRYLDELLAANARFNLTAIDEPKQARERHVNECLRLVPILDGLLTPESKGDRRKLLDLGSGGGLPGMVLAIMRPDLDVRLLEATAKKARFLEATAQVLGLSHVRVSCERAESAAAVGGSMRGQFDVVTARAVAPLPVLLELAVPFLRLGGRFLAIKGLRADEELHDATRAMRLLQVQLTNRQRHPTATALVFEKVGQTSPKYPRRSGEPKKNPL